MAGDIRNYYFKFFGLANKSSTSWLHINGSLKLEKYDLVIGRSTRYINQAIDYLPLTRTGLKIGYLGTDAEYKRFLQEFPNTTVQRVLAKNALEAACIIANSSLYIGNQSLFFAIAEGLNHPRLLETFEPAPNVIPTPGLSGSFINTEGMLNMTNQMLGTTIEFGSHQNLPQGYLLSY